MARLTPALARSLLSRLPSAVTTRPELIPLQFFAGAAHGSAARATYVSSLQKSTRALERLRAILDDAESQRLRLLPLKGALFGEQLYGDPALRPMVDVDLAVRPSDLPAAVTLVEEHGYRRLFGDGPRYVAGAASAHDVAFVAPDGGILELHYRLFHELGMEPTVAPWFERSERQPFLGRVREVPAAGDHLFLVAVHAATHAFGDSSLWLFDLALLLLDGASQELALAEARQRRAEVPFRQAMRLYRDGLGEAVDLGWRDEWRGRLLDRVVGVQRVGESLPRWRSLAGRALLVDEPRDVLLLLWQKIALTLRER